MYVFTNGIERSTSELYRLTCSLCASQDRQVVAERLTQASRLGQVDIVEKLIQDGDDVNVADSDGWFPIHWASFYRNLELCKVLINAGANVNSINSEGWTPLHFAVVELDFDLFDFLIDSGADVYTTTVDEKTASDLALNAWNQYYAYLCSQKNSEEILECTHQSMKDNYEKINDRLKLF